MNFFKSIFSFLRLPTYGKVLEKSSKYFTCNKLEDIEAFQVEKFNEIWEMAYTKIPFYVEYKNNNNLPDKIKSLKDLAQFPIITKKDLQLNYQKLLRIDSSPTGTTMSGGSTGEPLKIPTKGRNEDPGANMWIGRSLYGVKPYDKTFVIWGHRHLNGKGLKKHINVFLRDIKDWLSNYKRVSAYDLSKQAMESMFNDMVVFKPDFVLGYSSALVNFCKINEGKDLPFQVKTVMCTASTLTSDDQKLIEKFFCAPVCKEYGSHETAVMAGTIPTNGNYRVFWDTHILQGVEENGMVKNIVTVLMDSYFPVIRYDIGDYIVVNEDCNLNNILEIKDVIGRPNDVLTFSNGASFNCILTAGCVKQIKSIISHQIHKYEDGIDVWFVALDNVSENDIQFIKALIVDVCPSIKNIKVKFSQVETLQQSVAGKTPMVINHNSNLNI